MKYETLKNLRKCPLCDSSAILRKNASKRFQVKCKKCTCATIWASKIDAVISWYNNAEFYEATHAINAQAPAEEKKRNAREELTEAGKNLLKYANDIENGGLVDLADLENVANALINLIKKE